MSALTMLKTLDLSQTEISVILDSIRALSNLNWLSFPQKKSLNIFKLKCCCHNVIKIRFIANRNIKSFRFYLCFNKFVFFKL